MNIGRILTIILGVILVILGIWLMVTPVATYLALAWVLGLGMILDGAASICAWFQLRKQDLDSGWTLAGGILSIILGLILSISLGAQLAVDLFIAVMTAIWLIVLGITRIIAGMKLRAAHVKGGMKLVGKRWYIPVILGVLVLLLGILSLFNPIVLMLGIGMFMGCCVLFAGLTAIGTAAS